MPLKSRGGLGGRSPPPHLRTKGSAQNSPSANIDDPHGDELMLVFSANIDGGDDLALVFFFFASIDGLIKARGWGGRRPPHLQTKSARPSPMNLGGTKRPRARRNKTMTDSRIQA